MSWLTFAFTSSGISPVLNHEGNDYSVYLVFYGFREPFRMADYFFQKFHLLVCAFLISLDKYV